MSVSAAPVAMYGLRFNDNGDVIEFMNSNGFPDLEDLEDLEELGNDLTCECLNSFTGKGFVLGFQLQLGETLDAVKERWALLFPNCTAKPRAILTAKLW